MIYSLFIERPRAGADPVPYLMAKTKSLAEAELWVAAPVLSAKAADNVREGDLFVARYSDTKLKISRVVAFGRVTTSGVIACTSTGGVLGDERSLGLPPLIEEGLTFKGGWFALWQGGNADDLVTLAAYVPRQILVAGVIAAVRFALPARSTKALAVAEAWTKGKADMAAVQMATQAAKEIRNAATVDTIDGTIASAIHFALRTAATRSEYAAPLALENAQRVIVFTSAAPLAKSIKTEMANRVRAVIHFPEVCFSRA